MELFYTITLPPLKSPDHVHVRAFFYLVENIFIDHLAELSNV